MSRRNLRKGTLVLAGSLGMVSLAQTPATSPRIRVGPNILVSRDGDFPHIETVIAANPKDPKNLIGASTTFARPPDGTVMNKTYASHDGGYTWKDSSLPIEVERGGGDPEVAFASDGTAFFVGINGGYGMAVHRSEDGGNTWQKPTLVPMADYEHLVVDQTTGRYAGRIYLAGEVAKNPETLERVSQVALWRSEDGGRSFIGPVKVWENRGGGLNVNPLAVLSDGILVVPMVKYPSGATDKQTPVFTVLCSFSTDGGITFSAPQKVGESYFGGYGEFTRRKRAGRIDNLSCIRFVAGKGPTRDRLYVGWVDYREGSIPRVFVCHSSDHGKSWSRPIPVDPRGAAGSSQYQPILAVNDEGTLGVFWFDTRNFPARDRYEVYFSASVDGGDSFLPPARVSSAASVPAGPGNLRPAALWGSAEGVLDLYSAFSIWPQGGDYMGATADSTGTFHPFWADSRTGTFQLYTAPVRVLRDSDEKGAARAQRHETSLSGKVTVSYDPILFDAEKKEALVPVRLKNISEKSVYGPLRIEIKEMVRAEMLKRAYAETANAPTILNASNGKTGDGAVFDYSKALGDFEDLEPGAMTEAVVWRLRISDPGHSEVHFAYEIRGSVQEKEAKSR